MNLYARRIKFSDKILVSFTVIAHDDVANPNARSQARPKLSKAEPIRFVNKCVCDLAVAGQLGPRIIISERNANAYVARWWCAVVTLTIFLSRKYINSITGSAG